MDAQRWRKVEDLFQAAAPFAEAERNVILGRDCRGDDTLRAEVESLLAAYDRSSSFIESPAFDIAPRACAAPAALASLLPGTRFGRYRILRLLGRGGMGVVYEAEQDTPRRKVALKVMKSGVESPDLLRRFRHEAGILARMTHPGIAQVFDAGAADSPLGWQPYIAMEVVTGEPITAFARARKLATPARLELFVRVCDAVQHAHVKGVLHRDLKPANILVSSEGQPKVLDFGVARTTDADEMMTTMGTFAGQLVGTLAYMSPEQVRGDARALDTRSDIYALGVVLYELTSDRLPYDLTGVSLVEAARLICRQRPPPLAIAVGGAVPELDAIVRKALEKDAGQRYASADALAEDVRRVLTYRPILARPPSATYVFRKFVERNRAASAIVAVLVIGLLALTITSAWLALRYVGQRDAAIAASVRESHERETADQTAMFLADLFGATNPDAQATSDQPTARELLDSGAARLKTELLDKPLVRARLLTRIGVVYGRLADYPRAIELLRTAVDLVRRERGSDHPDLIEPLAGLADALGRSGASDEQHAVLLERLELCEQYWGPRDERVAAAIGDVGSARFYARDYTTAIEFFEQSLARWREISGESSPGFAKQLHNLGSALIRVGRSDESEVVLRRALGILRAARVEPVEIGRTLEALAHLAYQRKDLLSAEQYLVEQVELTKQQHHARHPAVAFVLNNLAFIAQAARGPEAATPIYLEALDIRQSAYGREHPDVAYTLDHLGTNHMKQSRYHDAILYFEEAVAIRHKLFGPQDSLAIAYASKLGEAHWRVGDHIEAELILRRCFDAACQNGSATGASVSPAAELVRLCRSQDRPHDLADWLVELGESQRAAGDSSAAGAAFCEAAEIYARLFGPDDERTKGALANAGVLEARP